VPTFVDRYAFDAPFLFPGLAVTSHDPSVLNDARFSQVSVVDSPTEPLPNGWVQTDVGAVSIPGSASVSGSELTLNGDGADIWGTADAFGYVSQQLLNDGTLIARVTTLGNTSAYAKAGVMIRGGVRSAASAHALLDVKPDGGIEFMVRTADGQQTTFVAGGFQALPVWLKLSKNGQTFTGSVSMDGTTWTPIGMAEVPGIQTFTMAGLVVTSHDPGALTTATFDSIALTQTQGLPRPWGSVNVGSTGLTGNATYDAGRFIVNGAGSDIWGSADAFLFAYQTTNTDPAMLTARVVSETDTNPYAKAGLMLRSDTSASAAFVMIDLKPNGEIEVLQRPQAGAPVEYLGGAFTAFGSYLGLQRTGSTVVVAYSADGSNWTPLVTTTVSIPATAGIGLAVTSHDPSQLNTAVFDNVTGP
jgi:regulation of enolase protein 1 (concanavalin A-like superfamily)